MRGTRKWPQGLLLGGLLISGAWLGSLIWGLAGKAFIAVREANETETAYHDLEARKAALERDLELLATARGQDAAIREAFGVARPGEEVIVVVPPKEATTTPPKPWWETWFGWL